MKPGRPIQIAEFPGMNNVDVIGAIKSLNEEALVPHVILNSNVTGDKKIVKRAGFTRWVTLANSHSLYSDGTDLFCGGAGVNYSTSLWRIASNGTKREICAISGSNPLYYVGINHLLYIASIAWMGCYQYATGTVRAWGQAGTHYLTELNDSYDSTIMANFDVVPPPYMQHIVHYAGRIWGANGKRIYYSEPLAYDWYRVDNFFSFDSDVLMIAATLDGLYVGMEDSLYFIRGHIPEEMMFMKIGGGVIDNTISYCEFPKLSTNRIPVWCMKDGIVAGIDGKLAYLTKGRIRYDAGTRGASTFRTVDGQPQYLASFTQPSTAVMGDSVTATVIRNGTIL
jgi:hypothetical protein